MSVTAALCNSAKAEFVQGVHSSEDTYKMALFPSTATLSKATTAYSNTGELPTANGYTQGGVTLTGYAVSLDGDVAILDFADPVWASPCTFTCAAALIYNASKSNKAVAVLTFTQGDVGCSGTAFSVTLPAPAAATGAIRIA